MTRRFTRGTAALRISRSSIYSSFLAWEEEGPWADGGARQVATEEVEVRRLADELERYAASSDRCFLKVDAQGADLEVLEGARGVLERFEGAQVELSFARLYRDQPPPDAVIGFMREHGFELWAIRPVLTDPASARMLDVDAVFFRP